MLKHLLLLILLLASSVPVKADETKLTLIGRVQESLGKTDLMNAYAVAIDANGNPTDTLHAGVMMVVNGVEVRTNVSTFIFNTVHRDTTYVFEIGCEGYQPQTVVYKVEKLGKRESRREMPITYLERAPRKLGEVTVTASKIKFYNRGDTLVYNADAFQLAEGSMLDGLISQLPGVELNSDGQIKVNGEFVESLLLNGRQFFDGNNNFMLKNLAAYTVKNVEVYRGESMHDKWLGNKNASKHLTMDVKLKKEYSIGWILNAHAGYGTEDRYVGRLFASWFNPTTSVILVGNINNLNDTREPGKDSKWTPDMMPSGKMKTQLAGLAYSYQSTDFRKYARGNVSYQNNWMDSRTYTDRVNFYADRNTYDYSHSSTRTKNVSLTTAHQAGTRLKNFFLSGQANGKYVTTDRDTRALSASFDEEQQNMSMEALEAIYSDGTDDKLASVINRTLTRSTGSAKNGGFDASASLSYSIPRSDDRIAVDVKAAYDTRKERLWDDYDVRFGADGLAPLNRRNYTDNSPNHNLRLSGALSYYMKIGNVNMVMKYSYDNLSDRKDSYMYALDRLEDMGVYGTLPTGYLAAFDPSNSFTSSLVENTHAFAPQMRYDVTFSNGGNLYISAEPELGLRHSHYSYTSDGMLYPVRRTSLVSTVADANTMIKYSIGNRSKGQNMYVVWYKFGLTTETPELMHMVDVVDTSDPLNILLGNPNLKNTYKNEHNLSLRFFSGKRMLNEFIDFKYSPTANAIVRGYTYDMNTGIRRIRSYNVHGNYSMGVTNTLFMQFGRMRQFTLSSTTDATKIHSADMVGLNVDEPSRSTVNTRNLSEDIKLSWQIGKQSIAFKGGVTDRRTTSSREGFADIDATHFNYGLIGQFSLPAGFGISTDFTFYTRRGYGVKQLDTTDAVWNARATYTPRGGRWVFTVDGFDLLHRLSNVHYAVNASGRTVTYTNTLPRYVLFSVQYRLNIQPKKRF